MKKIMIIFLLLPMIVRAATEEYETITDALTDPWLDRSSVTKLIIKDIAGNDYISENSEWKYIRILDEYFPNIEELEILTDQDIPDVDLVFEENGYTLKAAYGLFYCEEWNDSTYLYDNKSSMWIKHFSAPNVRYIGGDAFSISGIESVYFPSVVEVADYAFSYCHYITHIKEEDFASLKIMGHAMFYCSESIISAKFKKVEFVSDLCFYRCYSLTEFDILEAKIIGAYAFQFTNLVSVELPKATELLGGNFAYCYSLRSVSIGTGFEEETEIKFKDRVFGENITENVELTISSNTIPKPIGNAWNYRIAWTGEGDNYDTSLYIWKTVNYVGIKEYEKTDNIYYLGDNKYMIENAEIIELYDIMGRRVEKNTRKR